MVIYLSTEQIKKIYSISCIKKLPFDIRIPFSVIWTTGSQELLNLVLKDERIHTTTSCYFMQSLISELKQKQSTTSGNVRTVTGAICNKVGLLNNERNTRAILSTSKEPIVTTIRKEIDKFLSSRKIKSEIEVEIKTSAKPVIMTNIRELEIRVLNDLITAHKQNKLKLYQQETINKIGEIFISMNATYEIGDAPIASQQPEAKVSQPIIGDPMKNFEKITLIRGQNVTGMSKEAQLDVIVNIENQIKTLEKVDTSTKFVTRQIKELKADIKHIVAVMDAEEDADSES